MTINWSYFTLQIFCILLLHTFFLIIILKKKKGKRLFHVIKIQTKITWSILNIYIFSDIKKKAHVAGRWISKLFDIHRPTHRWRWWLDDEPSFVPTTFISDDEDRRWSLSTWWEPSIMLFLHLFSLLELQSCFL